MPKIVIFDDYLKKANSVTRYVPFNRTKIGENAKIEKFNFKMKKNLYF